MVLATFEASISSWEAPTALRIRIVQTPPITSIDGVRLDRFRVGLTYQVGTTLGTYLLAEGWAEPVEIGESEVSAPFEEFGSDSDSVDPPNLRREFFPPYFDGPPSLATDRRRRRHR